MKNERLLVTLFALMLLAAACGGQSAEEALLEEILENSGEDIGDIDINTDDGNFNINVEGEDGEDINITGGGDDDEFSITVEGEDGETMTFGGGEVPDGVKSPIPDGGTVASTFSTGEDISVSLTYPGTSFDELVSFYDDRLDASDDERFESSFTTEDGTFRSVVWSGADGDWTVNVSDCIGINGDLDSVCVSIFESS
ncbi:MAG: hypothetical protein GY926_06860 [bacterium]|nr:hypothetical protein [bacterium]